MRPRTFILLILVLIVGVVAAMLIVANNPNNSLLSVLRPGASDTTQEPTKDAEGVAESSEPAATATPSIQYKDVVVAKTDLPIGTMLRADLLAVEQRPDTNIAFQGGYEVSDPQELVGQIVKVGVARGQEILRPMLALNPTDLPSLGSDLALYVDQGRIAVAIPINRYSGAAYAMRPGDLVDVLMTLDLVQLDEGFQTQLPNRTQRIDETALSTGLPFLLPAQTEGRLEFVDELGIVGEIAPASNAATVQIPRQVTQLTVQQAQVLWIGTWNNKRPLPPAPQTDALGQVTAQPTPNPVPQRSEVNPDLVILSMTAQEALSVKWALERGITVDLALRAPGDTNVFVTNSVSLPQLVDQGRITIPEAIGFDGAVRADELLPPAVPIDPPSP
jgi:pilus assembly protein CpaB